MAVGQEHGVDPTRLAVAGDSAGGNLATVVALLCRDRRGPTVRLQALAYPVTDHWNAGRASYDQYAEGYTLTREFMRWAFGTTWRTAWIAPTPTPSPCAPPTSAAYRRR